MAWWARHASVWSWVIVGCRSCTVFDAWVCLQHRVVVYCVVGHIVDDEIASCWTGNICQNAFIGCCAENMTSWTIMNNQIAKFSSRVEDISCRTNSWDTGLTCISSRIIGISRWTTLTFLDCTIIERSIWTNNRCFLTYLNNRIKLITNRTCYLYTC